MFFHEVDSLSIFWPSTLNRLMCSSRSRTETFILLSTALATGSNMVPSASSSSIATNFLYNLAVQVPPFVQAIEATLSSPTYHNVDVSSYEADHVCWRTETWDEYSELVGALKYQTTMCQLLIESTIGGRPIATFALHDGIPVPPRTSATTTTTTTTTTASSTTTTTSSPTSRSIHVIEIPAPKEGSAYKRGLEHVEFVIGNNEIQNGDGSCSPATTNVVTPRNDHLHQFTLDDFIKRHSSLQWNTKAKTKAINPDISLKIDLEDFGTCSVKFHLMPLAKVIDYEKEHNIANS